MHRRCRESWSRIPGGAARRSSARGASANKTPVAAADAGTREGLEVKPAERTICSACKPFSHCATGQTNRDYKVPGAALVSDTILRLAFRENLILDSSNTHQRSAAYIEAGTGEFWRANVALFAAAFSTFALLYCVQPLLPELARVFALSPTASSLALSIPTAGLGIGIMVGGSISEISGRKSVMCGSLIASALLTLTAAVAPSWPLFLVARALSGFALSGLPAVAMAYVSEEFHPGASGLAMGLYIGGTGIGGMTGRLIAGFLTDAFSWRWALGSIGGLALCLSVMFWVLLPGSRHFTAHEPSVAELMSTAKSHLRDRGLLRLYVMGFLLMGSNVSLFNYIAFRLVAPPYRLSQSAVGLIYLVYVFGVASSPWAGHLAGKRGSRAVLWVMVSIMLVGVIISLAQPLWIVLAGFSVISFGFFGAHTVASAWIGRRAGTGKALAASLYLFFYYAGASILGTATGKAWTDEGWLGVAAAIIFVLAIGSAISVRMRNMAEMQASGAE
jgi:MFS transporter, YNFM family, putative membrane transport protein